METVEFNIYEDFEQKLADRFTSFVGSLSKPCIVACDIKSPGGYTDVLREMEAVVSAKKKEGYVFVTNVDEFAYSCGLFFFLLGDVRLCSDEAQFMLHSSGFDMMGETVRLTSTDLRDMLEVLESDDELTNRILSENTKIESGMLEIMKKNDNFLSKQDLIYLGLIEEEYELI